MRHTTQALIFVALIAFFALPSVAHAAWFNSSYQYCRPLTIASGGTSGGVATTTTTGFALVATSTISTLAATSSSGRIFETTTNAHGTTTPVDVALTNGTDCNDDGGTLLDFYFEKYVQTTGEFVLWVEPDNISSTTAKTVLMYYGFADASATDQSDEAGTFGALGEVAVYNFNEDPTAAGTGGILDSTSNSNDGTDNGSMDTTDQVEGQVDGSLVFDGVDDYIHVPDNASYSGNSAITVMYWLDPVNFGDGNDFRRPVSESNWASQRAWRFYFNSSDSDRLYWETSNDGNSPDAGAATAVSSEGWSHIVGTYDANNSAYQPLYLNGSLADSITGEAGGIFDSNAGIGIMSSSDNGGGAAGAEDNLEGQIDDIRIYNQALHTMDILTIYNNTVDSTTFWTFGDEETEAAGGGEAPARKVRLLDRLNIYQGKFIIF